MTRKATGSLRFAKGKWRLRITVRGKQEQYTLSTCGESDEAKAQERAALLADLARSLSVVDRESTVTALLTRAAERDGKQLADVVEAARRLVSGSARVVSAQVTFEEAGEDWTSGRLAERFPDHVKVIGQDDNRERLRKHVYPLIGSLPIGEVTLRHATEVLSALPPSLSRATRRHVAMCIARVFALAVYPGMHIATSPLPRGWIPKLGGGKAMTFLYPDEDRRLLGRTTIDLPSRLLYGFLAREGMRRSEAGRLTWGDLDLNRGAVRLDKNKTDDPRAWPLDPGVVRALTTYHRLYVPDAEPDDRVFVDNDGEGLAESDDSKIVVRFRRHLQEAGVTRAELFEQSETRTPIRLHDLRASFITVSLANGRSETWVADRTGHKSSVMINRYRRAARTVHDLDLGDFAPLDEAIPELRGSESGSGSGSGPEILRGSASPSSPDSLTFVGDSRGGTRTLKPLRTADFESQRAVVKGREPSRTVEPRGRSKRSGETDPSPDRLDPDSVSTDGTPRSRTVAAVSSLIADATTSGDVATARALYGTLGALLAEPAARGEVAEVVDLASRRGRKPPR